MRPTKEQTLAKLDEQAKQIRRKIAIERSEQLQEASAIARALRRFSNKWNGSADGPLNQTAEFLERMIDEAAQ